LLIFKLLLVLMLDVELLTLFFIHSYEIHHPKKWMINDIFTDLS